MKHPLLYEEYSNTPLYGAIEKYLSAPTIGLRDNVLAWIRSIRKAMRTCDEFGRSTQDRAYRGEHGEHYKDATFALWLDHVETAVNLMGGDDEN